MLPLGCRHFFGHFFPRWIIILFVKKKKRRRRIGCRLVHSRLQHGSQTSLRARRGESEKGIKRERHPSGCNTNSNKAKEKKKRRKTKRQVNCIYKPMCQGCFLLFKKAEVHSKKKKSEKNANTANEWAFFIRAPVIRSR